ncbi:hypothetical protein T06_13145 [Trichinella sp. T6]|nr:hypothetical protein T06_13145 [Trichinella sp. T6]
MTFLLCFGLGNFIIRSSFYVMLNVATIRVGD